MARLSAIEKQERVWRVLSDYEPRDLGDIVWATHMSVQQVRTGWQGLKGVFGAMAVCEMHRERSFYYLADKADEPNRHSIATMVLRQSRDIHTRLRTELGTLRQEREFNELHGIPTGSVYAAIMNVTSAKATMATEVRTRAIDLGYAPETVERWLADLPRMSL